MKNKAPTSDLRDSVEQRIYREAVEHQRSAMCHCAVGILLAGVSVASGLVASVAQPGVVVVAAGAIAVSSAMFGLVEFAAASNSAGEAKESLRALKAAVTVPSKQFAQLLGQLTGGEKDFNVITQWVDSLGISRNDSISRNR